MKVKGKDYRTIWMKGSSVFMIEQNLLPFEFKIFESKDYRTTCHAIITMIVRGAGAIGAAAGYAMAQAALLADPKKYQKEILKARKEIECTRPTARNLFYAVERVYAAALDSPIKALAEAEAVAESQRCLNCGCGEGCGICATICAEFAIHVIAPDVWEINKDECVACGMCFNRCPNKNIEMVNLNVLVG